MSQRPPLATAAAAFGLPLLAPRLAAACAVCLSGTDDYRLAFTLTTVFMTALPLSMVLGFAFWLRGKSRAAAERSEASVRPEALPGP